VVTEEMKVRMESATLASGDYLRENNAAQAQTRPG
jgi:hypothetical protein